MQNHLVISAIGQDRPGIVDAVSKAVLDTGCNIMDSRMSVLGGEFAVILLVAGNWSSVAKLESSLPGLEKKLDLTMSSKRTERRTARPNLLPYAVEVIAMDQPGIVHKLANFLSTRNINIEDLRTDSYAAPHTGTAMFATSMTIGIPANVHISELREQFLEFCDEYNLDATLEPIKG